jgi:hypothetical protein
MIACAGAGVNVAPAIPSIALQASPASESFAIDMNAS